MYQPSPEHQEDAPAHHKERSTNAQGHQKEVERFFLSILGLLMGGWSDKRLVTSNARDRFLCLSTGW
jgi:hypothetical protein